MQKLRLAFRGWSRRREEQEKNFLQRNTAWSGAPAPPDPAPKAAPAGAAPVSPPVTIDLEGLQAAYLDGSGVIAYYLDVETGEVIDVRDGAKMDAARYKRVPNGGGDLDERRAFIATLDATPTRAALMKSVAGGSFRTVLASDRAVERAWYNFRNARATAAIEAWLKSAGLR